MGMDDPGEARRLLTDCGHDLGRAMEILRAIRKPEVVTVEQAVTAHIDQLTRASTGTRGRYRQIADSHVLPEFGRRPVDAVTRIDVGRWLNRLVAQGASDKSIRNWHGFLSGVMSTAVREGWTTVNPCAGIPLPADGSTNATRWSCCPPLTTASCSRRSPSRTGR